MGYKVLWELSVSLAPHHGLLMGEEGNPSRAARAATNEELLSHIEFKFLDITQRWIKYTNKAEDLINYVRCAESREAGS